VQLFRARRLDICDHIKIEITKITVRAMRQVVGLEDGFTLVVVGRMFAWLGAVLYLVDAQLAVIGIQRKTIREHRRARHEASPVPPGRSAPVKPFLPVWAG